MGTMCPSNAAIIRDTCWVPGAQILITWLWGCTIVVSVKDQSEVTFFQFEYNFEWSLNNWLLSQIYLYLNLTSDIFEWQSMSNFIYNNGMFLHRPLASQKSLYVLKGLCSSLNAVNLIASTETKVYEMKFPILYKDQAANAAYKSSPQNCH